MLWGTGTKYDMRDQVPRLEIQANMESQKLKTVYTVHDKCTDCVS